MAGPTVMELLRGWDGETQGDDPKPLDLGKLREKLELPERKGGATPPVLREVGQRIAKIPSGTENRNLIVASYLRIVAGVLRSWERKG